MEEEAAGLLKVIIVQGKNLVIRDFTSSDPYVVVKVGNQVSLGNLKLIVRWLFPVDMLIRRFYVNSMIEQLYLMHYHRTLKFMRLRKS